MLDTPEPHSLKVKRLRQARGLSQKQLADLMDLGPGGERTISGWERGEHKISPAKLNVLGCLDSDVPFLRGNEPAKFRFIDLFAGIGGMRIPFQEIGGRCVFTSEWDRFAKKTYAANFGEVPDGDITEISVGNIPKHDLLLGGFPCQAFSQAGLGKGFYDTRGTMFFEIQRILAACRPKAFLLENVKRLRGHDEGRTLQTILSTLRGDEVPEIPDDVPMSAEARKYLATRLNYEVDWVVLKATDFGVPQARERVYLIGYDRDVYVDLDLRPIIDDLKSRVAETSLGRVLEDNRQVDQKYAMSDKLMAGHARRMASHTARGNGFGYTVFNRDSTHCHTMTTRYYKDGREILIDQGDIGGNPRKLTPRECARIQGFPEQFRIDVVSDTQLYKQFGNSVSVPVIEAIAKLMVPVLIEGNKRKSG